MNPPENESTRVRPRYLKVTGVIVTAVGVILAKIGTTSIGQPVLYLLVFFAGLGLVAYSQTLCRKTMS